MGAADAVPGVSGGTIALVTGIYERLIRALTTLDPRVIRFLPRLHRRESRLALWESLRRMDLPFLIVLGTGMVSAVIILARLVHIALAVAPGATFAFFFGLIGASAVVLFDRRWVSSPRQVVAGVVGFVVAFVISGGTVQGQLGHSLPVVFGSGAVAITGMILPGISGAFILLLLGQYEFMTDALNDFIDQLIAVASDGSVSDLVAAGTTVVTFLAGGVVGLLTVAHIIRWALDNYRASTLSFLVSLMIGALRKPVIEINNSTTAWTPTVVAGLVVAAVVGAGGVLLLDYYTQEIGYDGPTETVSETTTD